MWLDGAAAAVAAFCVSKIPPPLATSLEELTPPPAATAAAARVRCLNCFLREVDPLDRHGLCGTRAVPPQLDCAIECLRIKA